MSQNAILDRETVIITGEAATMLNPSAETLPKTWPQREHLSLVDWEHTADIMVEQGYPVVVPAGRPWFGWSEAGVAVLMLASGAAAIMSLLNL